MDKAKALLDTLLKEYDNIRTEIRGKAPIHISVTVVLTLSILTFYGMVHHGGTPDDFRPIGLLGVAVLVLAQFAVVCHNHHFLVITLSRYAEVLEKRVRHLLDFSACMDYQTEFVQVYYCRPSLNGFRDLKNLLSYPSWLFQPMLLLPSASVFVLCVTELWRPGWRLPVGVLVFVLLLMLAAFIAASVRIRSTLKRMLQQKESEFANGLAAIAEDDDAADEKGESGNV